MTGFEHHVSELYYAHDGDCRKVEVCRKCVLEEICPGPVSSYVDTRGFNDLKPIQETNQMIEDIRNLAKQSD